MRRRRTVAVGGLIVIAAIGAIATLGLLSGKPTYSIVIATGTAEGTYFPLGRHLASLLRQLAGVESADAVATAGSADNLARLHSKDANLAFAMRAALVEDPLAREELRLLAKLYSDVHHILVRNDLEVEVKRLSDLADKIVYIGEPDSGERIVAQHIFGALGIEYHDYHAQEGIPASEGISFGEAADLLIADDSTLDAALVVAGAQNQAVTKALGSGKVSLLSLPQADIDAILKKAARFGLRAKMIPRRTYPNQEVPVRTIEGDTYLVAHADLDPDLVRRIVKLLFDNLGELLESHTRTEEIRFHEAFADVAGDSLPDLHPGAQAFVDERRASLRIAAGILGGPYHDLGEQIRFFAGHLGIESTLLHTNGSAQNLAVLSEASPVVAVLQRDAALAALYGQAYQVYGRTDVDIPSVPDLSCIARLYDENLYIIQRSDAPDWGDASRALGETDPDRICVGRLSSGTELAARTVLTTLGVDPQDLVNLPVPEMVARMDMGEIDIGFFMSFRPSGRLKAIVEDATSGAPDARFRLLGLDPATISAIEHQTAFEPGVIELPARGNDGSTRRVPTISTPVVLAVNGAVRDVRQLTHAILGAGEAYLDLDRSEMARRVKSLPPHLDAMRAYEDMGLIDKPPRAVGLQEIGTALAILVVLIGAIEGLLKLKRDRTANEIGRRVLAVPLEAEEPDSVAQLLVLRREIHERVRRRWWQPGEIDRRRWHTLHELVDERIEVSRGNLMRWLVGAVRNLAGRDDLNQDARLSRFGTIEHRLWESFTLGELDAEQKELLRTVIDEGRERVSDASGVRSSRLDDQRTPSSNSGCVEVNDGQ